MSDTWRVPVCAGLISGYMVGDGQGATVRGVHCSEIMRPATGGSLDPIDDTSYVMTAFR